MAVLLFRLAVYSFAWIGFFLRTMWYSGSGEAAKGKQEWVRRASLGKSDDLTHPMGDLAEIGRKVTQFLKRSKGGINSPDARVRATVIAINAYLEEMYVRERLAQISRHAQEPVRLELGPDAKLGLEYIEDHASEMGVRAIAQNALDSGTLTLAEADELARVVNRELSAYGQVSPGGRARLRTINSKIGGLETLHAELSNALENELTMRGEPGLREYGRDHAALSRVRDGLRVQINPAELERSWLVLPPGRLGAALERELKALADSGIKPNRASWRMAQATTGARESNGTNRGPDWHGPTCYCDPWPENQDDLYAHMSTCDRAYWLRDKQRLSAAPVSTKPESD